MLPEKKILLKPGKERPILHRHHWIFSGAVQSVGPFVDGEILPVYSSTGLLLGSAYANSQSNIFGRMVAFGTIPPLEAIQDHLEKAIDLRKFLFNKPQITNAFRLINGEGDSLPGLVVDSYADVLVVQISTQGMEQLRKLVLQFLIDKLSPRTIYEKSNLPSRREEGLKDRQGLLYGEAIQEVSILENGLKFLVNLESGQKTGFFLDHREMRAEVHALSKGKRVLNCFAYTGGFTLAALAGGAFSVDSVEISEKALEQCKNHATLNGFSLDNQAFYPTDVFQFLREQNLPYDLIILDPPAFAKKKKDVVNGCRGYKDINRLTLEKMMPKSILLTCSCSHHIDENLFQQVVFQAAVEAKRTVKIIGCHKQAPDHPVNICHPEGNYLKSLLLYVE